ncbi:response regulator transcription factor [Pandoraea sp. ISTKB]|uniref:response regulator transcription factor n=1 Tax=Pandoraea sp. ISTKB TaxID=1586708 RepID=UPI0008478425|nr:response regulator transcription factor [Pandoraea sp. ISTKB]ODP35105.1 hypothetical protein A9762_12135 [Pandoraea sp. ISTKB]
MTKVCVAVSDVVRNAGICALLREALPNVEIVDAHCAKDVRATVAREDGAMVVIDLDFEQDGAFGVIADISTRRMGARVLAVDFSVSEERATRALRSGARGILCAGARREHYLEAFRCVLSDRRYIHEDAVQALVKRHLGESEVCALDALSNREYQTLCLLGRGVRLTDIAKQLELSIKTIAVYRSRVLEKLGLNTTGELVRFAIEHRVELGERIAGSASGDVAVAA